MTRSKLKILLAEDNPVNQKVALHQLKHLGYDADIAANGQEVLEQLAQSPYDIILMDCQMPVLDGYAATEELRRREGQRRHTVVIAMTAHAMAGDREKCLAAGMDDYLSKPVRKEDLEAVLSHWMRSILASNPASDADVPIDLDRLHQISDHDSEFELELMQTFVQDVRANLEAARLAIQSGNLPALEHQAHRIKGASANVGARSLQAWADCLERQAQNKVLEGSDSLVANLEDSLAQVIAFMSL